MPEPQKDFQQEGVTYSSLSARLLWRQCLEGTLLNRRSPVPLRDDVSLRCFCGIGMERDVDVYLGSGSNCQILMIEQIWSKGETSMNILECRSSLREFE